MTVDQDGARIRVVEAGHELRYCGFACSGRPDDGDRLSRLDDEVEPVQDRMLGVVAERDVPKFDPSRDGRQLVRVRPLHRGGHGAQQITQFHHCSLALLIGGVELHQLLDRSEERGQVQQEGEQLADGEGAVEDHAPADQQQHGLADDADRFVGRPVDGAHRRCIEVGVSMLADDVGVLDHVVGLPVRGGDDTNAGQALGEIRQDLGDLVPNPPVASLACAPEPDRQQPHRGNDNQQRDQRQLHIQREEHARDDEERQALHGEVDQTVLEQGGQRVDIARHPGHQSPGLLVGVEVQALPLEV